MESYSGLSIFDTKGTEYLLVIGYLLVLIIFWKISNKQIKLNVLAPKMLSNLSPKILNIPQGLFYNKAHTWAHLEKSGIATIGMDDFLQHVTGRVDFVKLKKPGEIINKGDLLTEIDQGSKRLRIFSPVSGKIMDTNSLLYGQPEVVNEDPYEKGWVYKIKPTNWVAETKSYYFAEEAIKWATKEVDRFKEFLVNKPVDNNSVEPSLILLQDGGELRDNILSELSGEIWIDFQREFLDFPDQTE